MQMLSVLALDYGLCRAPASLEGSTLQLGQHPLFDAYIERQNERQREHYEAGKDLAEFEAEDWREFVARELQSQFKARNAA